MSAEDHHVVEPKTYFVVFGALMLLLVLTVVAAQIPYPLVNIVVAVTIAVAKATLIVLFFMHVRYSSPLTRVVVAAGFAWLIMMLALIFSDVATREWDREANRSISAARPEQLAE